MFQLNKSTTPSPTRKLCHLPIFVTMRPIFFISLLTILVVHISAPPVIVNSNTTIKTTVNIKTTTIASSTYSSSVSGDTTVINAKDVSGNSMMSDTTTVIIQPGRFTSYRICYITHHSGCLTEDLRMFDVDINKLDKTTFDVNESLTVPCSHGFTVRFSLIYIEIDNLTYRHQRLNHFL